MQLSAVEARIIGCLIEKSLVTPDQYPLSLNSLTAACNQKSSREPKMSLQQGEVQRVAQALQDKNLLRIDENFRSGVKKYSQRLCNTRYSDYHFDDAQLGLVCVLLLRGAQTPGELRTNSRRLHAFADNTAVVETLKTLQEIDKGPLVQQLPRTPGRRDAEYMHLFCGADDLPTNDDVTAEAAPAPPMRKTDGIKELGERVTQLEAEVEDLKERLAQIRVESE